jgi:hypothetical protein
MRITARAIVNVISLHALQEGRKDGNSRSEGIHAMKCTSEFSERRVFLPRLFIARQFIVDIDHCDTGLQVIMNDGWARMRQNIVMPLLKYCSENGSENLLNIMKLLQSSLSSVEICRLYQVIHKSVKHLKNSQQINYATGHDNSYANKERNISSLFFKESPPAELQWFAARKQQ